MCVNFFFEIILSTVNIYSQTFFQQFNLSSAFLKEFRCLNTNLDIIASFENKKKFERNFYDNAYKPGKFATFGHVAFYYFIDYNRINNG